MDTLHGANQHPIDLGRFLVRMLTNIGDTVLELFGGVGTMSMAAVCEGRSAVYVDGDASMYSTARARLNTFFESEIAKAAFLRMKEGDMTEEVEELARVYAQGVVVDPMKPTEEAVEELLKQMDNDSPWIGMANKWKKVLNREMDGLGARDFVRKWLHVLDKAAFEGYRASDDVGDRIKALDPRELEKDILQREQAQEENGGGSCGQKGVEASAKHLGKKVKV